MPPLALPEGRKMSLTEAVPLLCEACNRPFGELFSKHPKKLNDAIRAKGFIGQLLLLYLGLRLDGEVCDFSDGELKTNKSYPDGTPEQTMWICQINELFDTLVSTPPVPYEKSYLHKKIRNLLYLPVVKVSDDPAEWYFKRVVHVQSPPGSELFEVFRKDYETICRGIHTHLTSGDGLLHTTNGRYLQIRTKDSGSYTRIYSDIFGRYVSTKNFGFYFQRSFMIDALAGRLPPPSAVFC
jgi:DNA mismatch repair protein MutH